MFYMSLEATRSHSEILNDCAKMCDQEEPDLAGIETVARTLPEQHVRDVALTIIHCPEFSAFTKRLEFTSVAGGMVRLEQQHAEAAADRLLPCYAPGPVHDLRDALEYLNGYCFKRAGTKEYFINYRHNEYGSIKALVPLEYLFEMGLGDAMKNDRDPVGIWCPDLDRNLFFCTHYFSPSGPTGWRTSEEGALPKELSEPNTRKLRIVGIKVEGNCTSTDKSTVLKEFTGCTIPETFQLLSRLWQGKMVDANRNKGAWSADHLRIVRNTDSFLNGSDCQLFQVDSPSVSCIALSPSKEPGYGSYNEALMKVQGAWIRCNSVCLMPAQPANDASCVRLVQKRSVSLNQVDFLDLSTNPPTFTQEGQVRPARQIDVVRGQDYGVSFWRNEWQFKLASPALLLQSETDEREKQMVETINQIAGLPLPICKHIVKLFDLDGVTLPEKMLTGEI
jgi:hypothetical protein